MAHFFNNFLKLIFRSGTLKLNWSSWVQKLNHRSKIKSEDNWKFGNRNMLQHIDLDYLQLVGFLLLVILCQSSIQSI